MHPILLLLLVSMVFASGCASQHAGGETLHAGVPSVNGAAQARRDIAHGRLRVMEGGGYAIHAPGVPADDARLAKLPRHCLPCGCTNPDTGIWMEYARAYNAVMVAHIQKQPAR